MHDVMLKVIRVLFESLVALMTLQGGLPSNRCIGNNFFLIIDMVNNGLTLHLAQVGDLVS